MCLCSFIYAFLCTTIVLFITLQSCFFVSIDLHHLLLYCACRCFFIVGMILWIMSRDTTKSEEQVIQEVQSKVDEHNSLKRYGLWLAKNSPWALDNTVNDSKWVENKIKEMKQAHEVELRRKFYGYP